MTESSNPPETPSDPKLAVKPAPFNVLREGPLLNYSLATDCPQCGAPTIRRACKVRCDRCGFMWDCSEL